MARKPSTLTVVKPWECNRFTIDFIDLSLFLQKIILLIAAR